jgi:IS30 family transposase
MPQQTFADGTFELHSNTVMERLDNRPGKRLGYQTPNQVFSKPSGVALHI